MKLKNLISAITLIAVIILAVDLTAQTGEVRIPLKGNAYAVGKKGACGLEVNGKLVVPKNYETFQTDGDGIMFAVETKDGKWGVVDSKGTWIYKATYYKTQISGDKILLYASANSEPKFYKTGSPTVEVKVTKADPLMFDPATKKMHEIAEQKAKEIAAQDAFAAFSFKTTAQGRQELYVDGKKLFEAKTFELISTYDYYKKSTCWFFIVTDKVAGKGKDAYGLYGLSIYTKDGKKGIEAFLTIPIEYSYMGPYSGGGTVVSATTFSGAKVFISWYGKKIEAQIEAQ